MNVDRRGVLASDIGLGSAGFGAYRLAAIGGARLRRRK
jgi:hypothetical protein